MIGNGLGLLTYFHKDGASVISNISNVSSLVITSWYVILLTVHPNGSSWRFNNFQKLCLAATCAVFIFWLVSHEYVTANLTLQAISTIGYFPTLKHLWNTEKNTEPLDVWMFANVGGAISLYPAFIGGDLLAQIYVVRGLVFGITVSVLIYRAMKKEINGIID